MSAHVLVISKNPLALEGISQALRLHVPACTVDISSTGCDALVLLATHHFDAVVFPSCMPDADGLEFLKQVKSLRPDAAVFFVGNPEDLRLHTEALRLGVYAFIPQPLVIDQFIPLLRDALSDPHLRAMPVQTHGQVA